MPEFEAWPYRYRSMEEAQLMLLDALARQDELRPRLRAHVRRLYDIQETATKYRAILDRRAREANRVVAMTDAQFAEWNDRQKEGRERYADRVRKLAASVGEVAWGPLEAIPRPQTRLGDPLLSHHDLPAYVQRLTGLVDDVTSTVPVFRAPR
jgi:hypothetical protein